MVQTRLFSQSRIHSAPGSTSKSRKNFVYWNDEGQLCAIRVLDMKIHFLIQEHKGWDIWRRQFTSLRIPLVFNLRSECRPIGAS